MMREPKPGKAILAKKQWSTPTLCQLSLAQTSGGTKVKKNENLNANHCRNVGGVCVS